MFHIETISQFGTHVHVLERNNKPVNERAIWKKNSLSGVHEGDVISGVFNIERLHVLSNPGDPFNDQYYFRKNIFWKLQTISITSTQHQHSIFQKLRSHILSRFKKYDSFYHLATLTLGYPDKDVSYEKITELGLSHLFVISGLHFGLIFYLIFNTLVSVFSYHRLKTCVTASFIILSFYFLLCYPNVCMSRAYVVVCCIHVNLYLQRKTSVLALFILTSALLLAISPRALFDVSFQLSSIALLSLWFSLPLLEKKGGVQKLIISCAFIYLGTAPIILFYFQKVSLTGFFLNLILIPLFSSLIMPLLFLSLVASLMSLEFPILFILDIFFRFFEKVLCTVPPVPLERGLGSYCELFLLYVPIFLLFLSWRKGSTQKACMAISVLLLIFVLYPSVTFFQRTFQKELKLTYLDVGHGDALVVGFPQGKTMLIDAGVKFNEYDIGKKVIKPYFLRKHIKNIDILVISHPDQDHIGGVLTILQNFSVGEIWLTHHAVEQKGLQEIKELARKNKIPIKIKGLSSKGVMLADSHISFLWPPSDCENKNNNDCCLVFSLDYGKHRFWFMGDIGVDEEESIISHMNLDPRLDRGIQKNILKVAHHGSTTSTGFLFVEKLEPELAIISSGFRKPVQKVLKRLQAVNTKILRTDTHGAITLRSNGRDIKMRTECPTK